MSIKDWIDKHLGRRWRKILDQPLHFAWAFVALLPVVLVGPLWWAGGLSGLLLALPREFIDQWPIDHWDDTLLDLAFFILGGIIVCIIL